MIIPVVNEVIPFFVGSLVLFGLIGLCFNLLKRHRIARGFYILGIIAACYMLYFFRDPPRVPPEDRNIIVAGADGRVTSISEVTETKFLNTDTVRISIYLSLLDVHVNRSPIDGEVAFLGYFPGKHYFTLQEKSSEYNQHNSIVITNSNTRCLVNQIVGPVTRRVVYWLHLNQNVEKGQKIGMMKFGSRLDMYFPKDDIKVRVHEGDYVQAGVTEVARYK